MKKLKTILELYFTFCKIGFFTIGGGLAMLPILERELVERKKWVNTDELYDYFAISQSTPGIIAVNVATFCGYKRAGYLGGIIATFGVVTPSVIIISLLAGLINKFNDIEIIKKAFMGINVAVAANISYAAYKMAKKNCKNLLCFAIFILSFALVFILKVPVVAVLLSSIALGVIIYFVKLRKLKTQNISGNANDSKKEDEKND